MKARPFRSVLVVLVAIGGLTACNRTPSARRVALDVIDTLPQSEDVKECMRAEVEAYTEDEIEDFARGADKNPPDPESEAALAKFEADLDSCVSSG